MKRHYIAVAGLALGLASCADTPAEPAAVPAGDTIQTSAASTATPLTEIAKGFAGAMTDAEHRTHIRNALRRSVYVEHKVGIAELLRDNERLMASVAENAGMSVAKLMSTLADAPLDFYLAGREARLSWTPSAPYAVIADDGYQSEYLGYTSTGSPYKYVAGGSMSLPLFVVAAAEPKGIRLSPQPDRPGSTIQDADDGALAIERVSVERVDGLEGSPNDSQGGQAPSLFAPKQPAVSWYAAVFVPAMVRRWSWGLRDAFRELLRARWDYQKLE